MNDYPKVIAVDFDGTLCTNGAWPEIGAPRWDIINRLLLRQAQGDKAILWTCRAGKELEAAVEWCKGLGIHFDAVNESLPEWVEHFGNDSRKIGAHEYWDDKAVYCGPPNTKRDILNLILAERDHQDAKWGYPQQNTFAEWASILGEEYGEVTQELNELNFGKGDAEKMTNEAIQVAAVAVSIIEHLEVATEATAHLNEYRRMYMGIDWGNEEDAVGYTMADGTLSPLCALCSLTEVCDKEHCTFEWRDTQEGTDVEI